MKKKRRVYTVIELLNMSCARKKNLYITQIPMMHPRLRGLLHTQGCEQVIDILRLGREQFAKCRNVGPMMLDELDTEIALLGFTGLMKA